VCIVRHRSNEHLERENEKMTTAQLKNAKTNAVVELQIKYNRFSKGLNTPGVDKAAIEKVLDGIRKQIDELEREIAIIG